MYFGVSGSKEYFLISNTKIKFYDFTIPKYKFMCEYNGSTFHPRFEDYNWKNPFGQNYQEVFSNDLLKYNLAINNKFDIYYVWDTDDINEQLDLLENIIIKKYDNEKKINKD